MLDHSNPSPDLVISARLKYVYTSFIPSVQMHLPVVACNLRKYITHDQRAGH